MAPLRIPLARSADGILARLASATGSAALSGFDGATLLGERAMLGQFRVPGRISAGGGCRLLDCANGMIALNLARPEDRELLPALFGSDRLDSSDDREIARLTARSPVKPLLEQGRLLGLAIAAVDERLPAPPRAVRRIAAGASRPPALRAPRVLDLSALWAGPLAAHLLWLAGAEVTKVESRTRPDAMRTGDPEFFALLNQGKASVALDLKDAEDRRALLALIAESDIVMEAARPRGLAQLGILAERLVIEIPGLVWITITGHGAEGEPADWVGFGDDCGVAGGLTSAACRAGRAACFVGDAIADPLTGLQAAETAWTAWKTGAGGRYALAMSHVVAGCLEAERREDAGQIDEELRAWAAAIGRPFPSVCKRPSGEARPFGADSRRCLEQLLRC